MKNNGFLVALGVICLLSGIYVVQGQGVIYQNSLSNTSLNSLRYQGNCALVVNFTPNDTETVNLNGNVLLVSETALPTNRTGTYSVNGVSYAISIGQTVGLVDNPSYNISIRDISDALTPGAVQSTRYVSGGTLTYTPAIRVATLSLCFISVQPPAAGVYYPIIAILVVMAAIMIVTVQIGTRRRNRRLARFGEKFSEHDAWERRDREKVYRDRARLERKDKKSRGES